MLVLSLIAATVVPAMRNFAHGRRLSDAAAQLVSLANYARSLSLPEQLTAMLDVKEGSVFARHLAIAAYDYEQRDKNVDVKVA